jgi:hypoxanthine phosphoribosyltransferase
MTERRSAEGNPLQVLFSEEQVALRVREIGARITSDYGALLEPGRSLVLLSVLKGSVIFLADVARAIELPVRLEFLGVQSYGAGTVSSGIVQITQDLTSPIEGDDVLVIEDIVDTGLTLTYLIEQLKARSPRSVKVCALLHKPARMQKVVNIDYLGFTIADEFVVGYGLDHAQRYRNLPYIATLEASSERLL